MFVEIIMIECLMYIFICVEVWVVVCVFLFFVWVIFGGDELFEFGIFGEVFDSWVKFVFLFVFGVFFDFDWSLDSWWQVFFVVLEVECGLMCIYLVWELWFDVDGGMEVDIDFVLYFEFGFIGFVLLWVSWVVVGQELYFVGFCCGVDVDVYGGVEYVLGIVDLVVLVGDEMVVLVIVCILEDVFCDLCGVVFIEVFLFVDILCIEVFVGVEVYWLLWDVGELYGLCFIFVVFGYFGDVDVIDVISVIDIDSEDLLWEILEYLGFGEDIVLWIVLVECYFWIVGESGVVIILCCYLVKDFGIDCGQVVFMGYWCCGVVMWG